MVKSMKSKTFYADTWDEVDEQINAFTDGKDVIRITHRLDEDGPRAHVLWARPYSKHK